jgi:hypothetical protein
VIALVITFFAYLGASPSELLLGIRHFFTIAAVRVNYVLISPEWLVALELGELIVTLAVCARFGFFKYLLEVFDIVVHFSFLNFADNVVLLLIDLLPERFFVFGCLISPKFG